MSTLHEGRTSDIYDCTADHRSERKVLSGDDGSSLKLENSSEEIRQSSAIEFHKGILTGGQVHEDKIFPDVCNSIVGTALYRFQHHGLGPCHLPELDKSGAKYFLLMNHYSSASTEDL